MRFNTPLLVLASLLGAATAFRRTCRPNTSSGITGSGFYTLVAGDTWRAIAADFCTSASELQNMNNRTPFRTGAYFQVPCRPRKRDCARIPGSNFGYYRVVKGDKLTFIAEDFCTNADGMLVLNSEVIKSYNLPSGTILRVPCAWN
ncbi:uncharacterized protein L3040_001623 [Drepanopeziza brunnea f. sp. 'multigermtubi']|uniref:Putative Ecp7(P20) n=1 Tax=Marssonina brunnea f. sp. multigermtubi (strain MB_m1) TaxID=1072389 RepID=K1XRN4_MARBU|nr:putative Ecp7(P20) [Drepanopeziza brunnea f. sp. 'multigermtubi' MB_m1]EKD15254.1 putative Ecp7(P20) [Drepanopeziza brunnea f. sp. 'multigermtubi' MB_m1]KAJ5051855.1 hypothetical protein L3040_001623 [Drepanopeziza brunnea f. sp. 'multigermtubi']